MIEGVQGFFRRQLAGKRSDIVPLACIVVVVLVANLPALAHLVSNNPLLLDADLGPVEPGWLPGLPYTDPNAGFTLQALGHLAALDWLHGHIPWWNPYEGIGSPLAGEMQSGAFFPPTLVLTLHQGVLLLQIALEAAAGWATYFLVRRLQVGRSFAVAAGVAFGLCGTFAWFAHAPIRPVALLPLSLLGVERALSAAAEHRRGGWRLLACAIALSILAGFPETTFLDGLLVVWWAALRMAGPGRSVWRPMLGKVVAGALVGAALSAPLLVAFVDYLPFANVGDHSGGFAHVSLPAGGLSQLLMPYSLGPIFGLHSLGSATTLTDVWGSVGGYLDVTLIAAALVGAIGRQNRTLRVGLGAWVLVCLLRTYGFPPVVHAMAVLPGVKLTAFFRYADPSWELAVIVLAALGLNDIARNLTPRRMMVAGAAVTALLSVWATISVWPTLTNAAGPSPAQGSHRHVYVVVSLAVALVLLTLLVVGALWAGRRPGRSRTEGIRRRGRVVMAAAVCVEAAGLLGATYLSAPPPAPLEAGSVSWLQAHLGTYRFATLGPIQPNYGSYFGVAEVDVNDLPIPSAWSTYIQTDLDTNVNPLIFTGQYDPPGPTPADELTAHLASYEAVGVRYVVESAGGADAEGTPFPAAGSPAWPRGPRLVYHDTFAEVWELPAPAAAFSVTGAAATTSPTAAGQGDRPCTVTGHGWDRATVRCDRPSVLVRRVQYMNGWAATVDGRRVPVRQDPAGPPGLFQQVSVPAGTSQVSFTFLPPHELVASVAAVVGAAVLLGSLLYGWRRRQRGGRTPP